MSALRILFSIKGRIGRRLFWLGTVIPSFIIAILLYLIDVKQNYNFIIYSFGYLTITWIGIAGYTKRLHDINQSGWIQLIFFLPASITLTLSFLDYNQNLVMVSGYVTFLIGLWISIRAGLVKGVLGKNKFSEDMISHSRNYFRWIEKFKNRKKNNLQQEAIKSDDFQVPSNKFSKPIEEDGTKSSVLESWLSIDNQDTSSKSSITNQEENDKPDTFNSDPNLNEPEILQATHSVFDPSTLHSGDAVAHKDWSIVEPSTQKFSVSQSVNKELDSNIDDSQATTNKLKQKSSVSEQKSEIETERFLGIIKKRATDSPVYQLYLQNSAETGNSWAKLEIAATWLSNINTDKERAQKAIHYLGELANSGKSHLGAEIEAAYFLGEIYRIGFRYTRPNEDLSFKYMIRAAALGHKFAQHNLTTQIIHSSKGEDENTIIQSLIKKALVDTESATALMLLIELDWSITYIDSINLVLRTLVDKGDNRAASFLGRMLLEQKDYKTSVRILDLADKLDDVIIDKVISIIKDAQCPENIINSFVNIIKKHARLDNSYANYQIALAYKEGIGVPQDNMMAFVHITMASARVYGHERDKLIKLRDELRGVLNEEEISNAQKIIRKNYVN